jgi:hypothetical protein
MVAAREGSVGAKTKHARRPPPGVFGWGRVGAVERTREQHKLALGFDRLLMLVLEREKK